MSDISAFGITATLPTGWDGRIGRRTDPVGPAPQGADAGVLSEQRQAVPGEGTENPVAHLANFPLPPTRGDYGSGAVERMGRADVLVCLVEFDPEAASTELFRTTGVPRFRLTDFSPDTMQRTVAGMCGAQSFFNEAGRAFAAYVVLGSFRLRGPLVVPANDVLSTLHIAPR